MARYWPTVSVVMATLNSERTIEEALQSISSQKYAGGVEIVIADGGSTDRTLEIARKHGAKIYKNPLKTGEAGKAIGAKKSLGEIIALIDSDNVLPATDFIERLVKPLVEDSAIIASEPLFFTYRKEDSYLTRYFALLGMGDPLSLFIGNYDRYSLISNKWTELPIEYKDRGDYLLLNLKDEVPTIGANGFFIRKDVIKKYPLKDYLFDIDVIKFLTKNDFVKVAKVKCGLVHIFSGDVESFIRKQKRRIRDRFYFGKEGAREKDVNQTRILLGIVKFTISTILFVPLIYQTLLGYVRKKDSAWFFHPIACSLTLLTYGYETVRWVFKKEEFGRKNWRQ